MTLRRPDDGFETRYSPGGDDFLLVEFAESMSLEANLQVQQVAAAVEASGVAGVVDICPANVSLLIRYDANTVGYDQLIDAVREVGTDALAGGLQPLHTRVLDLPVLFQDPWTHEVLMKFRDRVQDPTASDIEHLARINGLHSPEALVAEVERSPGLVTMTGFIPGVLCTYALVEADRQIEGPKYLRPRTTTPERALGFGGTSRVVYPVPGPGGYPLVGRAAAPVYDRAQRLPDFRESPALVRLGDLYDYRSIDRAEYDDIQEQVAAGTFTYRQRKTVFDPAEFFADPVAWCAGLKEVLAR